ncbi:hypothetical protein V8E53_000225, partial [Lactarius tabidus]
MGTVMYDQLVKASSSIAHYLTRQLFWDIGRSPNKDACRLTDSSPHADTPFDDLTGSFARIGSKCPKLSHPRCIDTALIFHDPRGQPLKPALAWLAL